MADNESNASGGDQQSPIELDAMLQMLDPATLQVEQTLADGLVLDCPQCSRTAGVTVQPCFPVTEPERFLIFCDAEGNEIGMLEELEDLAGQYQEALRAELAKQHFIPIITRVEAIYREFMIPIWEVQTDCGPRRLELKSNHDIHRLAGGRIYVRDAEGNGYVIPDVEKLDRPSRDLIELYV